MDVTTKYHFWSVGSFLAAAFLIGGILLVYDGMTHSTTTNSFSIFANRALAATRIILLGSQWESSKSAKGLLRHGGPLKVTDS